MEKTQHGANSAHNVEKGANTHLSQTSDTLYNIYL